MALRNTSPPRAARLAFFDIHNTSPLPTAISSADDRATEVQVTRKWEAWVSRASSLLKNDDGIRVRARLQPCRPRLPQYFQRICRVNSSAQLKAEQIGRASCRER